ncbi:hypothetical protein [Nocardioides daphniae]|uniref:hypothetical protein n=1 Tax=Nocardioides daphniae TaxID=402297 RepID=UPI0013153176|nr:hypothetical protein [Nocardioides daphniae]
MTAILGALALFMAGAVRAGLDQSVDPELVLGSSYALGGAGLMALLAVGVALGIGLARD